MRYGWIGTYAEFRLPEIEILCLNKILLSQDTTVLSKGDVHTFSFNKMGGNSQSFNNRY